MISDNFGIQTYLFIIPISFLTLVGLSNSVNLSDGLDGLAAGCSSITFYGLGTEILLKGEKELITEDTTCVVVVPNGNKGNTILSSKNNIDEENDDNFEELEGE